MFYYVLLAIWLVVIPIIIILSRKASENNIRLFIVQLYNFIVGLSAPIISFIIVVGVLMIFNDSGWELIIANLFNKAYAIGIVVVFTLLLIPMNKYMEKKINMNVVSYILLSFMSVALGIGMFAIVDKLSSIV